MYVCLCSAVSDRQIREAVRQGARTMRELRQDLGIATGCGRCGRCALQVLREACEGQHGMVQLRPA
jgi:bacterioferritin-associated ferredoxin